MRRCLCLHRNININSDSNSNKSSINSRRYRGWRDKIERLRETAQLRIRAEKHCGSSTAPGGGRGGGGYQPAQSPDLNTNDFFFVSLKSRVRAELCGNVDGLNVFDAHDTGTRGRVWQEYFEEMQSDNQLLKAFGGSHFEVEPIRVRKRQREGKLPKLVKIDTDAL